MALKYVFLIALIITSLGILKINALSNGCDSSDAESLVFGSGVQFDENAGDTRFTFVKYISNTDSYMVYGNS